ncbi:MAG TPA: asparaginase domain-containing protein [Gammaproteobacteria bacterium]|jgi:L-asparaginase|nr:asparaginase domain-containing protein [Gammaproteobacteria bacterium]
MEKLRIFTTGGTIDKIYFDAKSEYEVGEPQIGEILREMGVAFPFEMTSLMRKDSLDLTDADREAIRKAVLGDPAARVLITHGTDTMTETAAALQGIPGKTIVLTGSLNPARFRGSDAIFNIGGAVAAAQALPPGVYIFMSGRVFDAQKVRKNRDKNRFEEA